MISLLTLYSSKTNSVCKRPVNLKEEIGKTKNKKCPNIKVKHNVVLPELGESVVHDPSSQMAHISSWQWMALGRPLLRWNPSRWMHDPTAPFVHSTVLPRIRPFLVTHLIQNPFINYMYLKCLLLIFILSPQKLAKHDEKGSTYHQTFPYYNRYATGFFPATTFKNLKKESHQQKAKATTTTPFPSTT